MSQERTDEQILTREPIVLSLAGKKYKVQVLPIGKAIEWRKKLIAATAEISHPLLRPLHVPLWRRALDFFRGGNRAKEYIIAGLGTAFVAFPERVLELIFDYAPDLPRPEIINNATEEEVFTAFGEIMAIANPLRRQVSILTQMMAASPLRQANSTSSSSQPTDSSRVM